MLQLIIHTKLTPNLQLVVLFLCNNYLVDASNVTYISYVNLTT